MATIKSQMTLHDGMSGVLQKISAALQTTLHSFEQVQRAAGNAMGVDKIEQARSQLVGANLEIEEMALGYRRAAQEEEALNRGLRSGTVAADGMLGKVKGIVSTLALGAGLKLAGGLSDEIASGRSRLSLIVDDGGSVSELEEKIMASAQRSRAYYMDTMQTVGKMGLLAGKAFETNDELIAFTELMNKNFVVGGAAAQEQASAMYQLTQAMGSGRLQGDEYRSIIENAPLLAKAIEDYMVNVQHAKGTMKDWASEGMLTADVIKNALFSSADEVEARFAQMPLTWGQIWTGMKNKALAIFDPILTKMNQVANSEQFNQTTDGFITALATLGAVAAGAFDIVVGIGSFVVDNWSLFAPIVWGIVAAMGAYHIVQFASTAAEWLATSAKIASAVATGAKTVALGGETVATGKATMAQWGLNSALLASPITWIVLGIIAFAAALVAVCNWIAKTTGVAQTGFGVIAGGINWVLQLFVNLGAVVLNLVMGILMAFMALCSNVGIAFHNVIANVQGWFYGLLETALTVVAGICEALNKLPFVEFDYSGITNKADEYAAKSAAAYGSQEEYVNIGDAFREGFGTFDAFEKGWGKEAFDSGAAWGDGVMNKLGSAFDFDLGAAEDYGAGLEGYNRDAVAVNTGDTADNTKAASDSLEISNEQLEYLRDIAERDAINRFTTAEVKIDMTGMSNKIEGAADLDGVISRLTDGFTEALLTAAEGVHP